MAKRNRIVEGTDHTLKQLGLDDAMPSDPLGRALDGYEAAASEYEPTWVQRPVEVDTRPFHPGLAAALSFIVPGAGQVYRLRLFSGIAWLLVVAGGYLAAISSSFLLLLLLAISLHIACVVAATA